MISMSLCLPDKEFSEANNLEATMRTKQNFPQSVFSIVIILILSLSSLRPPVAHAQESAGVKRQVNAQTGRVSFLLPEGGLVLPAGEALKGMSLSERSADPALALVSRFGTEFGLKDPGRELVAMQRDELDGGRIKVRYQQSHQGIPVIGGELVVHTNGDGDLYSINGEVARDLSLGVEAAIQPETAESSALQAMAKWYKKTTADFIVSPPKLWIFDPALLMPSSRQPELVWRMEVTSVDQAAPLRELVLVNALRGNISLHFNQIDTTWAAVPSADISPATAPAIGDEAPAAVLNADVATYTAHNGTTLPGTFLCAETQPGCTNGADVHADKAHGYAIGTYNLYAVQHGRDSVDNAGAQLISTVHYDSGYQNAFWSGTQMVYGDGYGFALADDVVAHELTHGVTQHESNLFYFYQSGAINESFSDIWGEFYDRTNGQGNDSAGVAWQIGEDVAGLGAIRDLRDPTLFDQPDKMSSTLYTQDIFDNGGVHSNSGINNKAAYLMVNGAAFNGKTVSALGWEKTVAIYYKVNTDLLVSGADYSDLYFALQTACASLIGQRGITAANCVEVKDAIDAVEMNTQPVPGFNTDAPYCDTGDPSFVFSDGIESGTGNWTFSNGSHLRWQVDSVDGPYAHSGNHSLFADDIPEEVADASARLDPIQIPGNAYLHFAHAYNLESFFFLGEFDGGVLEYSVNGGSTWQDAGSLMQVNGYNGTVATGGGNPIEGRSAFVASSHGYISTRLNLASLAGRSVTFRWRMGLDVAGSGSFLESPSGWWLDDVRVYTCAGLPGPFNRTSPAEGGTGVGLGTTLSWNSSPTANYYQYCYDIIDDNQCNRLWSSPLTATSAGITNLGANTRYYWQVRAVNGHGVTQANNQTWGSFTTTSTLPAGTAGLETFVGSIRRGRYSLGSGQSLRESYTGVDSGPVKILSTNGIPFLAAERVIYRVNNVNTSFTELMSLPVSQLDTTYWLPWYNNVDLDTQLRFGNMSGSAATVHVYVGGQEMTGSPFTLAAGESARKSFPGMNNGPVRIVSNVNIIAAERVLYKVNGVNTSFSELMALPDNQLDTTYWLPWYNNVGLDTQLRIANVSSSNATVHIYIGGQEMTGSPFTLTPGASSRKSFTGIDRGPVKIVSSQNIVAAQRLIYSVNGVNTSFTEMMALPNTQLDTTYWLPWYNSVGLDTQLRIANVSSSNATVHVYIGGQEMSGSPFTLTPGASARKSFPGIDKGPVSIVSNQNIVAAERVLYRVNNTNTSFSELMGLPDQLLDSTYWLPWYNNANLDTQLRFGVP
jgi:bacillolysin